MEDQSCCPICFENFVMPKMLKCRHTFCLPCLQDFLRREDLAKLEKNKAQPLCENKMPKSEGIPCPLCRTVCAKPERDLQDLCSNYFVQIGKPRDICSLCQKSHVMKFCSICNKYTCSFCFRTHLHKLNAVTETNDDETEDIDPSLPIHLRFGCDIKTFCFGNLMKEFRLKIPSNHEGKRTIYSVVAAQGGGAYVLPQTVPFILKFKHTGVLLEKIRTPDPCTCIIEMDNGDILGIFRQCNLVLRYNLSFRGWVYFTSTVGYVPFALDELSDGRVIVAGTEQYPGEVSFNKGVVNVYSSDGSLITGVEKADREYSFMNPFLCVSNKRYKTFAINDSGRHMVTVFDENLTELAIYTGPERRLPFDFLNFLTASLNFFHAIEMACSPQGEFYISCSNGTLHILGHDGRLRRIAVAHCTDGFGEFSDVAVDISNNVWCSNSETGTIKIFRILNFVNIFDVRGEMNLPLC